MPSTLKAELPLSASRQEPHEFAVDKLVMKWDLHVLPMAILYLISFVILKSDPPFDDCGSWILLVNL